MSRGSQHLISSQLLWLRKVCGEIWPKTVNVLTAVSKHSRAARRGEIDTDGEVKLLERLPKAESSDLKKSIIRTTIKNENLLARKMEMDKIRKKGAKKKNSAIKFKSERGLKVEGILATKIQQSIDRAKFVQNARKSGWDQINRSINITSAEVVENTEPKKSRGQIDRDEEDEYVRQFYMKGNEEEVKNEENTEKAEPKKETKVQPRSGNVFALLDETEA